MNTQRNTRGRLWALAAAGLALAGVAATPVLAADATPVLAADARPVTPLNGWSGRMGPGLGSTKTPFGVVEAGTPQSAPADDTLLFHTSTGQPAQQAPVDRMGPGAGSSKSPFGR